MLFDNVSHILEFDSYLQEKHNLAGASRYKYVKCLEFFMLKSPDIDNIDDYNKFIIERSIKKRSNYVYSVLKSFIKFYVKDANKRTQMIENLIRPELHTTVKQERRYLTEKEIVNVINNLKDEKHKIIALIQDLTGVRAGDVLRMRRGSIVPEIYEEVNVLKLIITGKGNKRNVVYIHEEMIQKLILNFIITNVYPTGYYFMEDKVIKSDKTFYERKLYKGNHMRYYRDLKSALELSGIAAKDFATHDYRRCFARRVWTRYKDVQVLQNLLNHQNPATTMRYLAQSGLKNVEYHKQMQS
jgi:integrase